MTKACSKCARRLRAAEDFYPHSNKCKRCTCADVRRNRAEKLEQYRAYDRARAMRPDRVLARSEYAASERGRAMHAAALRRSNDKHSEKYRARVTFGNAVRDGKVKRQPCEACGNPKTHGHHDDYSKPLDVRWLCTKHHAEAHRQLRLKRAA